MEIFKIVGIALLAVVIIVILKSHRPEMAIQLSLITGIIIFLFVADRVALVMELLDKYSNKIDIDMSYISILFKIIGIAYITEFGSELCKDTGEMAIASKIELAGKALIMILAIPIITSLLDLVISLMP